jgi:hypothetical protein
LLTSYILVRIFGTGLVVGQAALITAWPGGRLWRPCRTSILTRSQGANTAIRSVPRSGGIPLHGAYLAALATGKKTATQAACAQGHRAIRDSRTPAQGVRIAELNEVAGFNACKGSNSHCELTLCHRGTLAAARSSSQQRSQERRKPVGPGSPRDGILRTRAELHHEFTAYGGRF